MGKSAVSGPFYGAKSLLWSVFVPTAEVSSNGATTNAVGINQATKMTVPVYEDWFVTEGSVGVSTISSAANAYVVYLKVEGGSSGSVPRQNGQGTTNAATILTMPHADTSTTWSTWATAAVSAGEYEGTWCPAGSTLRWVSSGLDKPGNVTLAARGFIRYIDSTRAS